jgi:SAM-dependent methyltransferase
MMIPQVARRLILEHSNEGDTLLDPFCGSGSVLVEAKLSKRNSWGIDLNPLAILIARVKTKPLDPKLLTRQLWNILETLNALQPGEVQLPDFFNIHFWFKEAVIFELAKLKTAISEIETTEIREFFQVIFSEAVRLSSNSRSSEFKLYRYPRERLQNYEPNPTKLFRDKAMTNIAGMEKYYKEASNSYWARPILGNTLKIHEIPKGPVDIVVTSPPYGDSRTTVAYGQFSRLSSQWLGLEGCQAIDKKSLGGIPVKILEHSLPSEALREAIQPISQMDERRAKDVLSFYIDLNEALIQINKLVKSGGVVCFVVGNRFVKGIRLPTDMILIELLFNLGYAHSLTIVRNIPSKTMPLRNSPTNIAGKVSDTIHKENIVIMRKE